MKLEDVRTYNKLNSDQTDEGRGYRLGQWIVCYKGPHIGWGVYDAGTGYRILHALRTRAAAIGLVDRIEEARLQLEGSPGWKYHPDSTDPAKHVPVWGDPKSWTSESIRAIGLIAREYEKEVSK